MLARWWCMSVVGMAGHMQSSFVLLLLVQLSLRNYLCSLKLNTKHNLSNNVACYPSHQHAPPSSKHQAISLTHDFFLIRNYHCSLKLNKKHNLSNHVACHPSHQHAPPSSKHQALSLNSLSHNFFLIRNYKAI